MCPPKFESFLIFLKSFGNSGGNSYTKFAILDIKFPFTCGESDLYYNIVKFQYIMTRIVGRIRADTFQRIRTDISEKNARVNSRENSFNHYL